MDIERELKEKPLKLFEKSGIKSGKVRVLNML